MVWFTLIRFRYHLYRRCFRFIVIWLYVIDSVDRKEKSLIFNTRTLVQKSSIITVITIGVLRNYYGFFYHWTIYLFYVIHFTGCKQIQQQVMKTEKKMFLYVLLFVRSVIAFRGFFIASFNFICLFYRLFTIRLHSVYWKYWFDSEFFLFH